MSTIIYTQSGGTSHIIYLQCYVDIFFAPLIVPAVPQLISVDRISGLTAIIHWTPLTPDEAKGILTQLQIAYESTNSSECSQLNPKSCEIMYLKGNLFEQSKATVTNLQPNREYCVAIEVSTIGGESGFSKPLKLTCEFLIMC